MGGEGIVLKDPASPYRPGERSPAWLKLKPKLTLEVVVTGGSAKRIAWGDWGEAVMLELAYERPPTGEPEHARLSASRAINRSSSRLANAPS
jgi:ATP-dependent DNA ligase